MRGSIGMVAATWAAVWSAAPVAHAQPAAASAVQIEWRAPAACPTTEAMRDQIAEVAGESMARGGRVHARARQLDAGWIVELDAGDGPRTLRGDTCEDVARAAALVIGLAVRRRAELPPAQIDDGEVPTWSRAGTQPAAAPPTTETRVERAAPWPAIGGPDLGVQASVGAAAGTLPGFAPMARAGIETRWTRASIRVEAAVAASDADMSLSSGSAIDVRSRLLAAAASGCWVTRPLSWCAGVEIGQVRATASAPSDQATGSGMWTAVGAGPSLVAPLADTVALVVQAEAAVPIVFPRFSVNGEAVAGPTAVSVRTGLGLRVDIP